MVGEAISQGMWAPLEAGKGKEGNSANTLILGLLTTRAVK